MNNALYLSLFVLQLGIALSETFFQKNWVKALYWFSATTITFAIWKMK